MDKSLLQIDRIKPIEKCSFCENKAVDLHHIIDRSLWKEEHQGNILNNLIPVCSDCHWLCEKNYILPEECWNKIKVSPILPENILIKEIDKWSNALTPPKVHLGRIKYPHTSYLKFSPSYSGDEYYTVDNNLFIDIPIIVTVKMDGSNLNLSSQGVAARNGTTANHSSFDMAKSLATYLKIPENLQIFGEWLYAKHSIHYTNLNSYFQVFSIFDHKINCFLSWKDTEKFCIENNLCTVSKVFSGKFNSIDSFIKSINDIGNDLVKNNNEGLVIRYSGQFHYSQFNERLGKWVRKNHVQTDEHWSQGKVVRNVLK